MKKIILFALILLFPQIVFSEMKQKTQGNVNNLPVNNLGTSASTPPARPTPDSGPISNTFPQWANFSVTSTPGGSAAGQAAASIKCQELGSGWRLPNLSEVSSNNSFNVSWLNANHPVGLIYLQEGGVSWLQPGGQVAAGLAFVYGQTSFALTKILCYHP